MPLLEIAIYTLTCLIVPSAEAPCLHDALAAASTTHVAGVQDEAKPVFSGEAAGVILTAESALAWDIDTGEILYEKNPRQRRPVASLSKLVSVLLIRRGLPAATPITIPEEVLVAQRKGANIRLPVGQHATVDDLLAASLIASANDAVVALAVAMSQSEENFVEVANQFTEQLGLSDTRIANATGLQGGEQYSTAFDIKELLMLAFEDPTLRTFMTAQKGVLQTQEGTRRAYTTTNELAGTYLPILAVKTGYTVEAKQNLALVTEGRSGQRIGAVILGSEARFQDMKILVEWVQRNYTWPG